MKFKLISAFLLTMVCVNAQTPRLGRLLDSPKPLDVGASNVRLPDDSQCYARRLAHGVIVRCGVEFKNVGTVPTCATCTPGHLMYKNYIGTWYAPKSPAEIFGTRLARPGSRQAEIYCDGPCQTFPEKHSGVITTEGETLPE